MINSREWRSAPEHALIGSTDSRRRSLIVRRLRFFTASVLLAAAFWMAATVHAQLSITEMMSSALKTNPVSMEISTNNSDYWELTNFGTNTVDLTRYWFADNKHPPFPLVEFSDPPLFISPGESVVFVRNNVTSNEMMFRAWWGSCVDSNVQIRFFPEPGFSRLGDSILVYDSDLRLVDGIEFAWATRGRSFVYDPNTGAFGTFSTAGEGGACRAETAEDIGSPGRTTGHVPLRIVQEPSSVMACLGLDTTLTVLAVGMPRPRYQWYFKGTAIPNATRPSLTISNASLASTGVYWVVIANGLTSIQSSNALVSIDTTPSPPLIISPPVDATVVTNRTARFSVSACASSARVAVTSNVSATDVVGAAVESAFSSRSAVSSAMRTAFSLSEFSPSSFIPTLISSCSSAMRAPVADFSRMGVA